MSKSRWILSSVLAAGICAAAVVLVINWQGDDGNGSERSDLTVPEDGADNRSVNSDVKSNGTIGPSPELGAVSRDKAVSLAREALTWVNIPADAPVKVELEDDCYVVTFLLVRPLRGPGSTYYGKIWVEKRSGKIRQKMGCDM